VTDEPISDRPEESQEPGASEPAGPSASASYADPEASSAPPPYAPSEAVSGLVEPESGPPPELLVGAAFAGGVALALILRRLTS
jgi:hypothetical protein